MDQGRLSAVVVAKPCRRQRCPPAQVHARSARERNTASGKGRGLFTECSGAGGANAGTVRRAVRCGPGCLDEGTSVAGAVTVGLNVGHLRGDRLQLTVPTHLVFWCQEQGTKRRKCLLPEADSWSEQSALFCRSPWLTVSSVVLALVYTLP
jgi:hypothetical protein